MNQTTISALSSLGASSQSEKCVNDRSHNATADGGYALVQSGFLSVFANVIGGLIQQQPETQAVQENEQANEVQGRIEASSSIADGNSVAIESSPGTQAGDVPSTVPLDSQALSVSVVTGNGLKLDGGGLAIARRLDAGAHAGIEGK